MRIGFTGHRDKTLKDNTFFDQLVKEFPNSTWVHGDSAAGFDFQVFSYATDNRILEDRIRPLYYSPNPSWEGFPKSNHVQIEFLPRWKKIAPLERNKVIVRTCGLLVSLWDGRMEGGTYFTTMYAFKLGVPVAAAGTASSEQLARAAEQAKGGTWNDRGVPNPTPERFPSLLLGDRLRHK